MNQFILKNSKTKNYSAIKKVIKIHQNLHRSLFPATIEVLPRVVNITGTSILPDYGTIIFPDYSVPDFIFFYIGIHIKFRINLIENTVTLQDLICSKQNPNLNPNQIMFKFTLKNLLLLKKIFSLYKYDVGFHNNERNLY